MTRLVNKCLGILVGLCLAVSAHAATLLPNGKQVFFNGNGQPLSGGKVTFYIPSTTTYKTTWQDSSGTIPNSNPVVLDSNGSAIIYGSGIYREVVTDALGNLIWDQLTADTSQGTESYSWGGLSAGTPNAQTVSVATFSSTAGQIIAFKAYASNTGAFTLNPSALGAIAVYKDTSAGPVPLSGGEIVAGNTVQLIYDTSLSGFHLVNYPSGSQSFLSINATATTDLGTVGSSNVYITGIGTVSSFGSSASTASPVYRILMQGAVTLVNSINLSLPGGGNIITQAGDSFVTVYTGSGSWQVTSYTRQADTPFVPSGAVMAFNLASCPAGWSAANGSGGTVNLVGYFIRGLDAAGTVDPTPRALGSVEAHAVQNHSHSISPATVLVGGGPYLGGGSIGFVGGTISVGNMNTGNAASETRPVNVALLYCQKN